MTVQAAQNDLEAISTKLAALLLLHEGEITLGDIEALPFVENEQMARAIALRLIQLLNADKYQTRNPEGGLSFWEEVIRLRPPTNVVMTSAKRKQGRPR